MKTFSTNLKSEIYYSIAFLLFISLIIAFSTKFSLRWIPLIIGLDLVILSIDLLYSRIGSIQIDTEKKLLIITKRNLLRFKGSKIFDLTQIQYTYKRRATSTGYTTQIVNVCTLYYEEKVIADLVPTKDGWEDDEVLSLVYELIHLGTQKKFIGYTLKDVELQNGS